MAVIHQAFSFDPASFHRELEQMIAPGGELRFDLLRDFAKRVTRKASADTKEYLRLLCFDKTYFDVDDDYATRFTDWYLIALGHYVYAPCSIGNQSFAAIELALPRIGWTTQEMRLLLIGQELYSLPKSSGVPLFASHCSRGLRHVSWLSCDNVTRLAAKLLPEQGRFMSPSQATLEALDVLPGDFVDKLGPKGILRNAYSEMTRRLKTAVDANAALVLINDVSSYQHRPGPDPL